jgi:hypothetical protein
MSLSKHDTTELKMAAFSDLPNAGRDTSFKTSLEWYNSCPKFFTPWWHM